MIKEEMKMGPKGQVVIPKVFRKALGLHPGNKVVFELKGSAIVIEKPKRDVISVFENIAKEVKYNKKIDPHEPYEKQLAKRVGRFK